MRNTVIISLVLLVFATNLVNGQEENKSELGIQFFSFFPQSREQKSRLTGATNLQLSGLMPIVLQHRITYGHAPVAARIYLLGLNGRKKYPYNTSYERETNSYSAEFKGDMLFNYLQLGLGLQRNYDFERIQLYAGLDFILFMEKQKFNESLNEIYRRPGGQYWSNVDENHTLENLVNETGLGFALPLGINIKLHENFRLNLESSLHYKRSERDQTIKRNSTYAYVAGMTITDTEVYNNQTNPRTWSFFNVNDLRIMFCYVY